MKQLTINSTAANINQDDIIALSRSIVDWQRLQAKSCNYSNTITLPFTDVNNAIFENTYEAGSEPTAARSFYEVHFIQDGVEIISYGKGKLIGTNENGYEFSIYWGNIDLKEAISGKSIQELTGLNDYNHTWDISNIQLWFLYGGQIAYPVQDLSGIGEDLLEDGTALDPLTAQRMIPFVSANEILAQIASSNGLTFNGNIYAGTNQYIPVATKLFKPENNLFLSFDSLPVFFQSNGITGANTLTIECKSFDIIEPASVAYNAAINATRGTMYINPETTSATYNFSVTPCFRFFFPNGNPSFTIYTVTRFQTWNGATWVDSVIYTSDTETITSGQTIIEYDLETTYTQQLTLTAGQEFRVSFSFYVNFSSLSLYFSVTPSNNFQFQCTADILGYGGEWSIAKNLPDLDQWDFLNSILFIRGLIFENTTSNVFNFKKISDVINDVPQDLSGKLQYYNIPDIHTELAQTNEVTYKSDETVPKRYGRGQFTILDNTLKSRELYYELPFAASEETEWTDGSVGRYPILLTGAADWVKVEPRIYQFRKTQNVYISDGGSPVLCPLKYVAEYAPLESNLILYRNYGQWINILNGFKRIRAFFKLTDEDFTDIDMMKPVYCQQLAGSYIIESMNNHISGGLCEINLIRI